MADVYLGFGILLALGIVFPGMLFAWWLLFPGAVDRARDRVQVTPWRCTLMGLGMSLALGIPVAILLALPFAPAKIMGIALGLSSLGVSGIGAAGVAAHMAERFAERASVEVSRSKAFLAGAVGLELAAAFPAIGWFLVIPLAFLTSLGAAAFSLLRWESKGASQGIPDPVLTQA